MQLDMTNSGRATAESHSISQNPTDRGGDAPGGEAYAPPARNLRDRLRRPLLIAVPALVALIGSAAFMADRHYVSTDDAYVRSTKGSINARVSGQVVEIAVRDNQFVRKGQLLFRIDPEPYQVAVEQAEARLASAEMEVRGLKATFHQQLAELQSARDSAVFDRQEFDRRKDLLASDFTSREDYERAEKDFKVAGQHIVAAQQQVSGTVAALNGNPGIAAGQHPTVRQAKAELDRAKLNLAYTRVVAPEDGIVTKVDDLQLGDFVNPGAATFAMMSTRHVWIEANFRETDLTDMRPGQAATIAVDAYPGHLFRAHVMSMSPGTGSQFSLLPPENATGNWVKVVQRLPVRLALDDSDPKRPLYAGISVTARVDTRQRPQHLASSSGARQ
jgi:membrane fusion protein (multidrug efflux system)